MIALKYFLLAFVLISSTCGSKSKLKPETKAPVQGAKVVYNPNKGIWYDNSCNAISIGSKPADYKGPVKNQPSTIFSTEGSQKDFKMESLHSVVRTFTNGPKKGFFDDSCNFYSELQKQQFGQQAVVWDDEPPPMSRSLFPLSTTTSSTESPMS